MSDTCARCGEPDTPAKYCDWCYDELVKFSEEWDMPAPQERSDQGELAT